MAFGYFLKKVVERMISMIVRLEIEDSIVDKVMFFLQNLPKNEVKLDVESETYTKPKKLRSISLKTKGFKFNREEANAR